MQQLKGTPNQGLFGATLAFFLGFAAVSLFGPTVREFAKVMEMTPLMMGFLVAMPTLSGSLLRIPFGAWGDSSGGRRLMLILLILSFFGLAGLLAVIVILHPHSLNAGYYPLLLLLGLLGGCGIATFPVGIGQVSYWFPQNRQGWALGIFGGLANTAPGIFAFLLPISLANLGLASSYLAWLVFLGSGIVLYYFTGTDAYFFQFKAKGHSSAEARKLAEANGQTIFPSGTATQSLVIAARIWKTWALVAVYFTSFGGFVGLTAWFPTYWTQFYGVDLITAGILAGSFSILTSVMRVAGGSISDRLGGELTSIVSISLMLLASVMLALSGNYALSIAGAIVMAVGMGITNAAVFKIVPKEIKEAVGGAAGWIGGIGAFGGFALPPTLAAFVDWQGASGYASGFISFVILSAVSLAIMYILKRARPKENAVTRTSTDSKAA